MSLAVLWMSEEFLRDSLNIIRIFPLNQIIAYLFENLENIAIFIFMFFSINKSRENIILGKLFIHNGVVFNSNPFHSH